MDGRDLDGPTAAELAALCVAIDAADAPHVAPIDGEHLRLRLKHGWDGHGTPDVLLARAADGSLAGMAEVELPPWDNPHLAAVDLRVHPAHRDTDLGSALLDAATGIAVERDRRVVICDAWADTPMEALLVQHGYRVAMRASQRRLLPADADWPRLDALAADAERRSADYAIVEVPLPTSDDALDAVIGLHTLMNDAPVGDLALEDDQWSPARVRGYEAAMASRGFRVHRLVAQRRADDAFGGFTVVVVENGRPSLGFQEDTAVGPGHRGNRLGLRLKIAMLRLLAEREPQLRQIDTWNADSNTHMIAVNEAIGCFVVGRGVELQRELG